MKRARPILTAGFIAGTIFGIFLATFSRQDSQAQQEELERLRADLKTLPDPGAPFVKVSKLVMPSVVHIVVSRTIQVRDPFDDFFDDPFFRRFKRSPRRFEQQGQGSGFIIESGGLIMTNHHVVDGADKIIVRLHDGRELGGKLVGRDPVTDVALIRVEAKNLPAVAIGDSSKLEVGEWVVAFGNPFGLEYTVTTGIISAKGRTRLGILDQEDFIQTDAAINPGNSGGPLVNVRGEVIGINSAIFSRSGGYQGIGFAVPINLAWQVQEQLQKHGRVIRGSIGVKTIDVTDELSMRLRIPRRPGALVSEVLQASTGLQAGDLIVRFDGVDVKDSQHFRSLVLAQKVGAKVRIEAIRRGKTVELEVSIEESGQEY